MNIDFEIYSDLDLSEVGLQRYARHESTRVILATIRDAAGDYLTYDERDPDALEPNGITFDGLLALLRKAERIDAWNAPFEYAICTHTLHLDIPLEKFYCTMAHAHYRALPGGLDDTCSILGIRGKIDFKMRLISLFCKPRKPNTKEGPTDWQSFRDYNIHDVEMEFEAGAALNAMGLPWPRTEREIWLCNERINLVGVPVDTTRAEMAWWGFNELAAEANARIAAIGGMANPNSPDQIKGWCATRGVTVDSIAKDELPKILARELPDDVREVLNLRSGAAMTAPKKFEVALRQNWQGRMCNMVQYSGAGRTHRFSGRGLQPHNMRRGPDNDEAIAEAWGILAQCYAVQSMDLWRVCYKAPFKALADCIRSMIRDPDGAPLVVADYSSIEVVVLWWVAGAERLMQMFRDGKDPYKVFASMVYGVPYEQVTKKMRTDMKPPVLGGGFGLGADTMVEYADGMGIKLTLEECRSAVDAYRAGHPEVCAAWRGLEDAVHGCLNTGQPYRFGHVVFSKRGEHVVCKLPSGAEITYWKMRSEPAFWPDGNPKPRGQLVYEGIHQITHQWCDVYTWGGKLIENIVQSISRDVLVYGLLRAVDAGLPVFLHVHDEIVTRLLSGPFEFYNVRATERALRDAMAPPPWITNCPIKAEPFVCSDGYRKN